jgi:nucleotide-binding universal stress UspA family protein
MPPAMKRPVIVCYDGSRAAVEALGYAAALLGSAPVIIVTAWRELTEEMLASGAAPPAGDPTTVNDQAARAAREAAQEGTERAQAAGVKAEALVVKTGGPIWKAIEAAADTRDALLIVCGTARSGIKTVMPGDVAVALVQHASRPVLVVPTSKAAAERRRHAERDQRAREGAL